MYRIMLVRSKRDNYASLYQWLTVETTEEDEEGNPVKVVAPMEFQDDVALDEQVEKMLNDEDYSKSDFIIVNYVDYRIDATDYDVP